MREVLRIAWLVLRKDIRVESRSREVLYTTTFFAASCVLVFSFAFVRSGRPVEGAPSTTAALCDVVPTMLHIMGMEQPEEMTGNPLFRLC